MKHYDTNDRYTDKKHPKGKYKGDEKKIHNSLSQPDNDDLYIKELLIIKKITIAYIILATLIILTFFIKILIS